VGDPTLSLKEIIGNESQERMGLVMQEKDIAELKAIAERERAPMYVIGETTGEHNFTLRNEKTGEAAIDLAMKDMFGSAPKTYMKDSTAEYRFAPLAYSPAKFEHYVGQVLQLESVACKDWLTNKVDRSVTGLIAGQQTCGEIQLPLNNLGVTAIGYNNKEGIATSMGHAPLVALVDSAAGSRMAMSEALTNIVWAPLKDGIKGVSLSANWMWPCRNEGEDARLYKAVKGASDFACALGINIPTGKDSMSMTQKYPSGEKVLSPGTVIISTVAPVEDINKIVHPNLQNNPDSALLYIPFVNGPASAGFTPAGEAEAPAAKEAFPLGGSAFAQIVGQVGNVAPDVEDPAYFASAFAGVQKLVAENLVLAGHDISAGGMITTALEMCFANVNGGLAINAKSLMMLAQSWGAPANSDSIFKALFSETPGVLVQVANEKLDEVMDVLASCGANGHVIGNYLPARKVVLTGFGAADAVSLDIDALRDVWFKTSYLFDIRQVGETCAKERFQNYKAQPLVYKFPEGFTGSLSAYSGVAASVDGGAALAPAADAPMAAIIREKGSNGDREMAWALHLAGFRVKDVHMTDLITGRETLEDVKMIVFVGGFSNADTLGSAKGWAGAFLYNAKAKAALDAFYAREDTMSLGICNGCQLMAELGLLTPTARELSPKMVHNNSHKYESAFVGVSIEESPSIMLRSLSGSKLGIWVAHGEGKFSFPAGMDNVVVAARYNYNAYPAN
ncbi:MAG: phosphoribosylformylglycinamidine synthase subunit PurQ, partial [Bacteroidales bacterium]|nr:phosphoribosylformylglycinamidine synthase subunit PurQ [Bacteroidales bacterium]